MQLCSVSVDLDPIGCYYRIHGLGEPPRALRDVVLRRGLPRFLELFSRRGIEATFFVVGEDLDPAAPGATPTGKALVREAAAAGHEIASHSYSHPYEIVWLPRERVADEVDRAHALIGETVGRAPVGFRSPGYNLSATVMGVLLDRGYRYDSSILPAPIYYAAKATIMGAMRLVGRRSGSSLGDPRFLFSPRLPYRPSARAPWRRGEAPIVELPISVSPSLRLHVIGTSLLVAPAPLRDRLLRSIRRQPFFNFELHGIDLVDADEDGVPAELVARQPDLRVPLAAKRRTLEETLDRLALDFRFRSIAKAVEEMPIV